MAVYTEEHYDLRIYEHLKIKMTHTNYSLQLTEVPARFRRNFNHIVSFFIYRDHIVAIRGRFCSIFYYSLVSE